MLDSKSYLIEILEFYLQKVKTDNCTMDEIKSASEVLEQNMNINGTIKDFAEFYGKPESQIRATIARKLLARPRRVLLYPFHSFLKVIPDKWKK